jgi:hypothetical protein
MRRRYAGGERMVVDFSDDKAPDWVESDIGEVRGDKVFVSVLGACGLIYAEATGVPAGGNVGGADGSLQHGRPSGPRAQPPRTTRIVALHLG